MRALNEIIIRVPSYCMNKNYGRVILSVLCLCFVLSGFAQTGKDNFEVKLIAFKVNNKVYLRWFLGNATQWHSANKLGFNIERAGGINGSFVKLNNEPIKPISETEADKYDKKSSAYQTMLFVNHQPDYSQPDAEKSEDALYTMFIVQSSYKRENAILAGSLFVDSTIVSGVKYTYRVSVANVDAIKQKLAVYSVQEPNNMPVMPALQVDFGNRVANLKWDIKPVMGDYFAVIVERSEDSVNFTPLTDHPLISSLQDGNTKEPDPSKKIMRYQDKGLENDQVYYYRIKGTNMFGIESPPGAVVSGSCSNDLSAVPTILTVDTLEKKFILAWSMPDSVKKLVRGYEIWVSKTNLDSSYHKVLEFPVRTDLRAVFDYKPDPSNYFVIKAMGVKRDQVMESAPYLYQLKDSIPPAVPKGLIGTVDNKGVVTLKWKMNTEPDFLGYRIFRSFTNRKSYAVLNGTPFATTGFKDTLSLNQLNSNVYYRIVALDNRFNESAQSDSIHINRPDTIPPAPASIKNIAVVENKSIQVNWAKSFSSDVKNYLLFRKDGTDSSSAWKQLVELSNGDTSYLDKNIQGATDYAYKIQAVDFGNLKSNFSAPFNVKVAKADAKNKAINNLNAYVSHDKQYIELNWSVTKTDIQEYIIYRSVNNNDQDVSLIATIPADKKIFDDNDVKLNSVYTYYIKAIYKTAGYSNMEKIEVVY
ncbi:MAG: hypothetical protein JWN76_557 [Chitinophagaceae bacterium]|nr:hypothetical protein [Chitinophagaceae bacterium]